MALFTKENAASMGRKGGLNRVAALEAEKLKQSCTLPLAPQPDDGFREKTKLRAREHIERLQARIDDELDRRELDVKAMRDLADTVLKLEQVEQRLSNRPLPGTLKPTAQKPQRRDPQPEPMPTPSQPEPVISQADMPSVNASNQAVSGDWATTLF